ncbi:MAG: GAF domain-containing protein [Candidatus Manganitrophus sp. SA1]|nr:GAF domain-containing protein [Candidatus Manganitrophus morganii]
MKNKTRPYILPAVLVLSFSYLLFAYLITRNISPASIPLSIFLFSLLVGGVLFALFRLDHQKELRSSIEDLDALNEISVLMTQGVEVDDLFKKVFAKVQERLPALSAGALFLVDWQGEDLGLAASVALPLESISDLKEQRPKSGYGVIERVAKGGEAQQKDSLPSLQKEGTTLFGAVPLRSSERVLGVLSFWSSQPMDLTPREKKWLESVGGQIGLALERIQLQKSHLRREKEALALFQLSQATTSSLSIDTVVKIILNHVAGITESEAVWIMLYNPIQRLLEVVAARGFSDQISLKSLTLRPGQGVLGEVFEKEKLIFVPDVRKDHRLVYRDETERSGITSMIGIPLMVKGKAIGVIGLFCPKSVEAGRIQQERLDFLTTIASQVAIAIDNVKLYQDLEQKVTELRRLQGQLIQTEKLSAIGELVSGVAHEINNPLTSVVGFTQLLLETTENPRDREFLEKIFSEAMSCSEIIRNLLTFARRHPAEKSYNNINDIIRKALELKRYQLETDGVEIIENLSDSIPPIWVDPHQMQQVFFNIIHNAHQALLEKKKLSTSPLRLTIASEGRNGLVSISFHDTGQGILPDVLPKVFEPFFTTKEVGVGTGLGLSISYGIVKEHGGEILIENLFGEGVTFIVTFPINGQGRDRRVAEGAKGGSYAGRRILIVDDSNAALEMCTYILRSEGFRVEGVESGRAALERLRSEDYDLILTDLGIADMPGLAFHDALLKEYPLMAEKILFLDEERINPEARRLLEERKVEILFRPFGMTALKEAVYRSLITSLKA